MAEGLNEYAARTLQKWTGARLRLDVKVTMFIERTLQRKTFTIAQRVRIATQFLQDRVRVNLSRPVRKVKNKVGRIKVDPNSRSQRGEFPRADTTRLLKDIFISMSEDKLTGRVGTTLMYGLVLETRMDRSFLRRSLSELRDQILLILQGGSVGGLG